MISNHINYAILQEKSQIFAICFVVVLALSVGLFFPSRWRRFAAIAACILAAVWVVLLLPDIGYYLTSRRATEDWIVEPFHRELQVLEYVLIFMPALFAFCGTPRPTPKII